MINHISMQTIKNVFTSNSTWETMDIVLRILETSKKEIEDRELKEIVRKKILNTITEDGMVLISNAHHIFIVFLDTYFGYDAKRTIISKVIENSLSTNNVLDTSKELECDEDIDGKEMSVESFHQIINKIEEINTITENLAEDTIIEWLKSYNQQHKVYTAMIIITYYWRLRHIHITEKIWDELKKLYENEPLYRNYITSYVIRELDVPESFIMEWVNSFDPYTSIGRKVVWAALNYYTYHLRTISNEWLMNLIKNPIDNRIYNKAMEFYVEKNSLTLSEMYKLRAMDNSGYDKMFPFIIPCCDIMDNEEFNHSYLYYNMILYGISITNRETNESSLRRFIKDFHFIIEEIFSNNIIYSLLFNENDNTGTKASNITEYINTIYVPTNEKEMIRNKIIVQILSNVFIPSNNLNDFIRHESKRTAFTKILKDAGIKFKLIQTAPFVVGKEVNILQRLVKDGSVIVATIPEDAQIRDCGDDHHYRCDKIKIIMANGKLYTDECIAVFDNRTFVHCGDVLETDNFDMSNYKHSLSGFHFTVADLTSKK